MTWTPNTDKQDHLDEHNEFDHDDIASPVEGKVLGVKATGKLGQIDPTPAVTHDGLSGVSIDDHHTEDHAERHATGAADALTNDLDATARHRTLEGGTSRGTRRKLNLLDGNRVLLGVTDDAGNEEVDLSIGVSDLALGDLDNVNVTDPVTGQRLHYQFGAWVNFTPGGDPPPEEGWPDPFMSYPLQTTPLAYYGQSDFTIEYLSFEGFERPNPRPITLENCNNVTIRRIDSRKCTMGLLFALNCTNITVEYCRAENIAWEMRNAYLIPPDPWFYDLNLGLYFPNYPTWPRFNNSNDCNFYQMDNCSTIRTSHMKMRYGNTEDVFSHYGCDDVICTDLQVEGATVRNRPTSDGSESVPYTSASGTGAIAGDEGGSEILIQDSTFLNSGQVGMQIAGGSNCTFDNCVSYMEGSEGDSPPVWTNQPTSTYSGTPPMTGHAITNCRTWGWKDYKLDTISPSSPYSGSPDWGPSGGWFEVTPDLTGTVLQDDTLNIEDYRVVL